MKANTRRAQLLTGVLLAAGMTAAPDLVEAQRRQGPVEGASRFVIVPFRAPDRELGVKAAEELRSRVEREIPAKQVYVVPGDDIKATLEASGFSADTAPNAITARLLAQQLRADEYLAGDVVRTPDGSFEIRARMILTRDNKMVQPLPPATARKLGDAAAQVARSLEAARAQLVPERRCEVMITQQKFPEAIAAAREAIAAYPQSTLARACLAQAMVYSKAPADSIIAIGQEALAIDPNNQPVLALLAEAYKQKGMNDQMVEIQTRRLALDPSNVRLQTEVVNDLAASGNPRLAIPIIQQALENNPGDPELTRLQWLILLAAREYKGAIAAGEQLIQADTAAADSLFFARLAVAYASDSQPQKAAETVARGIAKFPNNATLYSLHSQLLRQAGQLQQAVEAGRRAVQIDPKVEHGWIRLAQAQLELGQVDEAFESLRQAVAAGENKETVGQIMVVAGNQAYKAAVASKQQADWEKAVRLLKQADEVAPSPQSKFLLGVSAFQLGDLLVRANTQAKSCDMARAAQDAFVTAQVSLPAGGSFQPDATKQLLGALSQYLPAVEGQVKQFCR